jgi:hypothetical protein
MDDEMDVQTLYSRMHILYPDSSIGNGVYAQIEIYAQTLDEHAPDIVQRIIDTIPPSNFNTFALFISTLWDTFVIARTQLFRRHSNNPTDFVCARINDIDTHTRLKQLFTPDVKQSILATLTSNGIMGVGDAIPAVRFVSFNIFEIGETLRVSQTITHTPPNTENGFAFFTGSINEEVLTCLAKRAAREYRIIGMNGPVSVHYDLYYERMSSLGGLFHRDSFPNDVPTLFVSLEYFIEDVSINGHPFPGVLIGPEIIEHTGDIEKTVFDTDQHDIDDVSIRVLLLDGNTVVFNNKYIHATPAIRGDTNPYNFIDPRRIDITPRMGAPATAMLSIREPRNFIRAWFSPLTRDPANGFVLDIHTIEEKNMREILKTDIVGGGKVPLKLTEFRLSGLTNIKIVFSDKEPIITHASTIKKMISTEISQLISLIKRKVAQQIKYLPHNTQQKNKIRHSKTKPSKTKPSKTKPSKTNYSKTKYSKTRPSKTNRLSKIIE